MQTTKSSSSQHCGVLQQVGCTPDDWHHSYFTTWFQSLFLPVLPWEDMDIDSVETYLSFAVEDSRQERVNDIRRYVSEDSLFYSIDKAEVERSSRAATKGLAISESNSILAA